MTNWIESELNAFEEQRRTVLKERGQEPFLNLKKGENEIEVDVSKDAKNIATQYGFRMGLTATVNGESGLWLINKDSSFYGTLLRALKLGRTKFKILRSGEKQKTRYEIL